MIGIEYIQGADLPDTPFVWKDGQGNIIPFSSVAHTFTLRVGVPGQTALLTKSSGFTGADVSPNLTIAWATSGELNTLPVGIYTGQIKATRSSDSKDRFLEFRLSIKPAIQ